MPKSPLSRTQILVAAGVGTLLAAVVAWRFVLAPAPAPAPAMPVSQSAPSHREAFVEIAVATALPEAELAAWQDRRKLLALLGSFAPGGAGEAERFRAAAEAMLQDDQASSFEAMSAERFILPPAADAELVAPQLTPPERARFFASSSVLVMRLRGPGGPPHWVARLGFGLASALAERLDGFVDDEARRRVETAAAWKARSGPLELGTAFHPDSISIELDPDEDADAATRGRLLSLGMRRFGAPDLELAGVAEQDAAGLARALTALCRIAASKVVGGKLTLGAAELFPEHPPSAFGEPIEVRLVSAKMASGNPDNELLEVVMEPEPRARLARLFSLVASGDAGLHAETDDDFQARLGKVRAALPAVLARWRRERGSLFMLVDFAAPGDTVESMWVQLTAYDPQGALRGTLANEPAHVPGLHHGDPVDLPAPVISGYRLELPSGERVAFP